MDLDIVLLQLFNLNLRSSDSQLHCKQADFPNGSTTEILPVTYLHLCFPTGLLTIIYIPRPFNLQRNSHQTKKNNANLNRTTFTPECQSQLPTLDSDWSPASFLSIPADRQLEPQAGQPNYSFICVTRCSIGCPERQQVYWQADYWLTRIHLTAWPKPHCHFRQVLNDAHTHCLHRK